MLSKGCPLHGHGLYPEVVVALHEDEGAAPAVAGRVVHREDRLDGVFKGESPVVAIDPELRGVGAAANPARVAARCLEERHQNQSRCKPRLAHPPLPRGSLGRGGAVKHSPRGRTDPCPLWRRPYAATKAGSASALREMPLLPAETYPTSPAGGGGGGGGEAHVPGRLTLATPADSRVRGGGGTVDTMDSKSIARKGVRVRIPPPA